MRINKKASIELGISTVVVLVIAMVLIAGGVAFIRGFLNKGTAELTKGFDLSELGTQPTAIEPLVFVQGTGLSMKSGSENEVKVGFFNAKSGEVNTKIQFSSCTSMPDDCGSGAVPIMTSVAKRIPSGSAFGFVTLVKASCLSSSDHKTPIKLSAGNYICNLQAVIVNADGAPSTEVLPEKQFIFEVTP